MIRRTSFGAVFAWLLLLVFGATVPTAGPVRLARQPDYHARADRVQLPRRHLDRERGRVANPAADRSPRHVKSTRASRPTASRSRSPPIATAATTSSSSRGWRHAATADLPHRQRRRGRLDARFAERDLPLGARRRRVSERRDALSECRSAGGQEKSAAGGLGLLRRAIRQTASRWSSIAIRRRGRGSTTAAALRRTSGSPTSTRKTYHAAPRRRTLQPLLADVGRRQHDLFRRRSAAERSAASMPGSPDVPQERQQHLQDSRERAVSRCRSRSIRTAPVLAVDVERRQGDRLRGECSGSGSWTSRPARRARSRSTSPATTRTTRSTSRRCRNEVDCVRHLAVGTPRGDFGARPDPDDCHRARRRHAHGARRRWRRATSSRSGRPTASTSRIMSDRSGRDEIWISDPDGNAPRRSRTWTTRRARSLWTPDSTGAALHGRRQAAVSLHGRRRQDA